jgi:His/Glu/Gln/Arg/opine family amino acid ABC transporter permease subunit
MDYLPQLLIGALVTLIVAIIAIGLGSLIGLAGAAAKLSASRIARAIADVYVTVIRGTPDLIIILIIFFGGTVGLSKLFGRTIAVNEFAAGSFALAFVFGAYATEIFRGAILTIPKGQVEAARALSVPALIIFFRVVFPQAWRLALPAFGNQSIIVIKQTSLISVVGLEELMRSAAMAAGASREPFKWYFAAACLYLVITSLSTLLLRYAEKRANLGMARG